MNGWVVVLLNEAKAESLIPALWEDIEANLASCGAEGRRKQKNDEEKKQRRWPDFIHWELTRKTRRNCNADCSLLTNGKGQSFSFKLFLQCGHKLLSDLLLLRREKMKKRENLTKSLLCLICDVTSPGGTASSKALMRLLWSSLKRSAIKAGGGGGGKDGGVQSHDLHHFCGFLVLFLVKQTNKAQL